MIAQDTLQSLSKSHHVRETLTPIPADKSHLHLSDPRVMMEPLSSQRSLKVYDSGCGGSPKRGLCPNANPKRADMQRDDLDQAI